MPGSTLPAPARLDERLRRTWARYLALLGAPEPGASDEQLPGLLGYHLHNYAAFLASHTDSEQDLRAAVDLYRTAVIPAREEFRARTGDADPSRHAFQVGCRATTALAVLADAAGDTEPARRWARLGREWIGRALACDGVDALLAAATERSCRLALHAVPALLTAVEHGVGLPDDTRTAARLLDVAVRWEASAVGDGDRHTRHGEIEDLRRRLAALDRQLTPAAKC